MSWLTPYLGLMMSTAQGINNTAAAFKNNDKGLSLLGQAGDVANKFAGGGLNGISSMMSSPDFDQLVKGDKQFQMDGIKYGALQKAYDAQRESYKKMMDKEFENAKKFDMTA